jgi:hypothetical protein
VLSEKDKGLVAMFPILRGDMSTETPTIATSSKSESTCNPFIPVMKPKRAGRIIDHHVGNIASVCVYSKKRDLLHALGGLSELASRFCLAAERHRDHAERGHCILGLCWSPRATPAY